MYDFSVLSAATAILTYLPDKYPNYINWLTSYLFLLICSYIVIANSVTCYKAFRYLGLKIFSSTKKQNEVFNWLEYDDKFGSLGKLGSTTYLNVLRSDAHSGQPKGYIRDDVTRFLREHFEKRYLRGLTLLNDMLPPLGFVGTIGGIISVFVDGRKSGLAQIDLQGMGLALATTLYALVFFTLFEITRIWLSNKVHEVISNVFDDTFVEELKTKYPPGN